MPAGLVPACIAYVGSAEAYWWRWMETGLQASSELGPDLAALGFLYQLGEIAAAGGDIRRRLFG